MIPVWSASGRFPMGANPCPSLVQARMHDRCAARSSGALPRHRIVVRSRVGRKFERAFGFAHRSRFRWQAAKHTAFPATSWTRLTPLSHQLTASKYLKTTPPSNLAPPGNCSPGREPFIVSTMHLGKLQSQRPANGVRARIPQQASRGNGQRQMAGILARWQKASTFRSEGARPRRTSRRDRYRRTAYGRT